MASLEDCTQVLRFRYLSFAHCLATVSVQVHVEPHARPLSPLSGAWPLVEAHVALDGGLEEFPGHVRLSPLLSLFHRVAQFATHSVVFDKLGRVAPEEYTPAGKTAGGSCLHIPTALRVEQVPEVVPAHQAWPGSNQDNVRDRATDALFVDVGKSALLVRLEWLAQEHSSGPT